LNHVKDFMRIGPCILHFGAHRYTRTHTFESSGSHKHITVVHGYVSYALCASLLILVVRLILYLYEPNIALHASSE